MHADVNKGAECNNICHHTLEHHPGDQMFHLGHVVAKRRRDKTLAWIPARLAQLADDVVQRRQADVGGDVRREIECREHSLVADQFLQRHTDILRHARHQRVPLRVHGAGVEWM